MNEIEKQEITETLSNKILSLTNHANVTRESI